MLAFAKYTILFNLVFIIMNIILSNIDRKGKLWPSTRKIRSDDHIVGLFL